MKRFVLVLLLAVLPLQTSWAAVAFAESHTLGTVGAYVLLLASGLAVLPLQTSWAAVAHCPPRESDGERASGAAHATAHDDGHHHDGVSVGHDGHRHDHVAGGQSDAPALDCSLFQFVAIDPPVAVRHSPPSPVAAVAGIEHSGHPSHVPDGIDRPKWRLAA